MTAAAGFIFGLVLGSFVKASADRLSEGRTLKGRSYCPGCKHKLAWYDLFPVLSFIWLRGRCRFCQDKISLDHLFSEVILGGILALLFYLTLPANLDFILNSPLDTVFILSDLAFKVFIVTVLSITFLTDLKVGLIFDKITYPAVLLAAVYLLTSSGFKSWALYDNLSQDGLGKYLLPPYTNFYYEHLKIIWSQVLWSFLSGLVASIIFALLIILTKGRGMGWGDVKYVFFLGLVLGFPSILTAIFLAFFLGALFALVLIVLRRKHFGQTIPFGPFLSLGGLLALLWGNELARWYLGGLRVGF